MEAETPDEERARAFFEAADLRVRRIPTSADRSADYLVSGDGPGYAVEVKSRNDPEPSSDRDPALTSERCYDSGIERSARIGRKQLASVDPEHHRIWLLWFGLNATEGAHATFAGALDLCIGTLYGIRKCLLGGDGRELDCYYARPGVFERWTELDGAIIADCLGLWMAANELSPRFALLRGLQIPRRFGSRLLVPTELEANGRILIADRPCDRRDHVSLRETLTLKYGFEIAHVVGFKPDFLNERLCRAEPGAVGRSKSKHNH